MTATRYILYKRIRLTQENTNKDILQLERGLGHAVEDVTENVFCFNELLDGRVGKLLRDVKRHELHSFGKF